MCAFFIRSSTPTRKAQETVQALITRFIDTNQDTNAQTERQRERPYLESIIWKRGWKNLRNGSASRLVIT